MLDNSRVFIYLNTFLHIITGNFIENRKSHDSYYAVLYFKSTDQITLTVPKETNPRRAKNAKKGSLEKNEF